MTVLTSLDAVSHFFRFLGSLFPVIVISIVANPNLDNWPDPDSFFPILRIRLNILLKCAGIELLKKYLFKPSLK